MKIIQFMASEDWGGAEAVFVELSNALAEKHHVTALLLRGTKYLHRFSPKVEKLVLRSHPTRHNPWQMFEIYRCLQTARPDVIHTHAVKATELIFEVNRFLHINHLGTKHNVRKGKIFNKLQWVTAVSEASRRTIHSQRTARVEVIPNGITPIEIKNLEKQHPFTILAVGRLDKVKGFDLLINQVSTLDFDFRLIIVGDGPEKKALEDARQLAGIEDKVQLTGFRNDIPQLMKKAHLVVVSSHNEGFSRVLIEGLFYADVVISTPVGVAGEILPALFLSSQESLGKKISEVHHNFDGFREEFARMCRRKKTDFLLPAIVDRYLGFYREMTFSENSGHFL